MSKINYYDNIRYLKELLLKNINSIIDIIPYDFHELDVIVKGDIIPIKLFHATMTLIQDLPSIPLTSTLVMRMHSKEDWKNIQNGKFVGEREAELYYMQQEDEISTKEIFQLIDTAYRAKKSVDVFNVYQSAYCWQIILKTGVTRKGLEKLLEYQGIKIIKNDREYNSI